VQVVRTLVVVVDTLVQVVHTLVLARTQVVVRMVASSSKGIK
jgi:hypothetical protein